jgi:hypothetical protein
MRSAAAETGGINSWSPCDNMSPEGRRLSEHGVKGS